MVAPTTTVVIERMDRTLDALPGGSAAQLEDAGHDALVATARERIETWRQTWTERLEEGLREIARRQQGLLDQAVADIHQAAWELLEVGLQAEPAVVTLPAASRFYYGFDPDIGWSEPVMSSLRRRLPGALGRRRVRARLHVEAARLVDRHIGRARPDFQFRLEDVSRSLCSSIRGAYSDRARRLGEALDTQRENEAHAGASLDVVGDLEQRVSLAELLLRLQEVVGEERSRLVEAG